MPDSPDHPAVTAVLVKIIGDNYRVNNARDPSANRKDDTQYK